MTDDDDESRIEPASSHITPETCVYTAAFACKPCPHSSKLEQLPEYRQGGVCWYSGCTAILPGCFTTPERGGPLGLCARVSNSSSFAAG